MKKTTVQKPIKKDKASIMVLIVAAVVFFAALFLIYSEDILNMEEDIFNPYGDEVVEFEKASVNEILSEEINEDEYADNAYVGSQELEVTVKSGTYKGETMVAYNFFGPLSGIPVAKGDGVVLTIKTHADGETYATVYEFNRIPFLAIFIILFFIAVVIIGGRTGLKSMIGLVFTILCLFTILIPVILKGAPPIISTFVICAYIALVCFTILGGVHRKTISAFLGTVSGTFLAMIFGLAAQFFAKIDGYRLGDAEPLLQLKYIDATAINIRGLMTASIIICALGAVMDVAMSISSALEEVHAANPSLKRKDLF
ncbi:MAG: YibE/F family protein, partial [Firmicutes bacterium]|nr:YibE/F family protein [Bacillota bacterium]MBR3374239.1 YibE/F family protein [Bacillota bacterium]